MITSRSALLALVLFVAAAVELLSGERELRAVQIAVAAAFIAPIAFRERLPWLPAVVQPPLATFLGVLGLEPEAIAEALAIFVAVYTIGLRLDRTPSIRLLAYFAVGVTANSVLLGGADDIFWVFGVFVMPPWLAGRLMRTRHEQEAQLEQLTAELAAERDRSVRLAAEAERMRIAQDIRVVLAAGVQGITAEADRLAARSEDPQPAEFARLRSAGAETTAELRRLLHLLH